MTDQELLKHAKIYIEKLAQGINPLDDSPIPKEDIVNNPNISKCLLYVSDFLDKSIVKKGRTPKAPKKGLFYITRDELENLEISKNPVYISNLVAKINEYKSSENMKNLSYANVAEWLVENGYMDYEHEGSNKKFPTKKGEEIGIYTEIMEGKNGFYKAVLLNTNAQKFIIDNVESIVEFKNEKSREIIDFSIPPSKTDKKDVEEEEEKPILNSIQNEPPKPKLTIRKLSPDEVIQFNMLNNEKNKNSLDLDDILDIDF